MQPHVSSQHLHFQPARPSTLRTRTALSRTTLRFASRPRYSISSKSVPPVSQSCPISWGAPALLRPPASHAPLCCSSALHTKYAFPHFFRPVNILLPARSHSRQTHITLGLPFRLSNSSTLRSQGYPQVLFEPQLEFAFARTQNTLPPSPFGARGSSKWGKPQLRMSTIQLEMPPFRHFRPRNIFSIINPEGHRCPRQR